MGYQNLPMRAYCLLTETFVPITFVAEMKQRIRRVLRLRQLRRQREMTQAQLAKRVGLPRSTICKFEKGQQQPNLAHARAIAAIFGEPIERVFEHVEIAS